MRGLMPGSAVLAALIAIGSAQAADLPARPAPVYKAPAMVPPAYSWTGCYVGGNLGGAWTHKHFQFDTEDEGSMTPGGFAGGGQIGCDYQFASNWLLGVQGMFDGTTIRGTDIDPTGDGDSYPTRLRWFATATARLGFLVTPSVLLYGKGGAAWVNEKMDWDSFGVFQASTGNDTRTGWDAGAGLEWMFAPSWSLWVEYDHMDFGTKNTTFSGSSIVGPFVIPFSFDEQIKQSIDKVLVGVNWRFNWGAAPVSSRY
jgi:outer membrane immunogenic protein